MVLLEGSVTRHVEVSPFSSDYKSMKDIPIGTCATAFDCPEDGHTYIILFYQTLYFGDRLQHSLLCPNQIRDAGNVCEDTPRQFDRRSSHGITLYDSENEEELFIKLKLDGVISLFDTRKPTKKELQECKYFVATSDKEWMPYSNKFAEDEEMADAKISSVSTTPSNVETDLHCEWLNALNHRHLSEVLIAAD